MGFRGPSLKEFLMSYNRYFKNYPKSHFMRKISFMSNILKNDLGLSMIQGMVIAGIVAGSALIMARLLVDQKTIQKGAESRDQVEDMQWVVFNILQDKEACIKTMKENNLLSSFNESGSHEVNAIWSKESLIFSSGGRYLAENVVIESMSLVTSSTQGTAKLYLVYEILNEERGTKRGVAARRLRKSVELRVQKKTEDGSFSSCYALKEGATDQMNATNSLEKGSDFSMEFCLEMNQGLGDQKAFIWDEVNGVCKMNSECPDQKVFVGIDASGTVLCKNIEDWVDFSTILDSTPVNCPDNYKVGFKIDNTTKSVRIDCRPP